MEHINKIKTVETFWDSVSTHWNILYKLIQKGSVQALQYLDSQLPDSCQIHVSLSCNKINEQELDISYGLVVMYLSPNNSRDNIEIMEQLYKKRITLPNLLVAKYSAFHIMSPISEILYDTVDTLQGETKEPPTINTPTINTPGIPYNTFKAHCLHGFSERTIDGGPAMPVMNIIITCPKKLLTQKTVVFKDKHEKKSERKVWMFTGKQADSFILDRYLLEVLGECNMLNFVSYIEIVPEEDASKEIEYEPLESLRDHLELVIKLRNPPIKSCSYCQISELQMDMVHCLCKKFQFCSDNCMCAHLHICK